MEVDPLLLPSHEDDEIEVAITEFSRSPIQVRVAHTTADDVPELEVFCAHLKSKLPSRLDIEEFRDDNIRVHASAIGAAISTIRRTAEAAALRIILNNVMKNTHKPTVLLGDFNDAQLSNTLGILSDQPSYRLYSDSTAAQRNDDGLFTAATLHQLRNIRDHAYSHEFKGVREVIDHVLVSEQFYDFSENRRWSFHEMKIWNDHVEDDAPETSDHGIVRAEFDWNPAR
jgi:endonuclease/exonuclease/phosphatase family metal-dependent hydrolase